MMCLFEREPNVLFELIPILDEQPSQIWILKEFTSRLVVFLLPTGGLTGLVRPRSASEPIDVKCRL
jgi:hypothetical protein